MKRNATNLSFYQACAHYYSKLYIRIRSGPGTVLYTYSYGERGLARVIVCDETNQKYCGKPKQETTAQQCQNLFLKLKSTMAGASGEAETLYRRYPQKYNLLLPLPT